MSQYQLLARRTKIHISFRIPIFCTMSIFKNVRNPADSLLISASPFVSSHETPESLNGSSSNLILESLTNLVEPFQF
jgi:hypothetical protein